MLGFPCGCGSLSASDACLGNPILVAGGAFGVARGAKRCDASAQKLLATRPLLEASFLEGLAG